MPSTTRDSQVRLDHAVDALNDTERAAMLDGIRNPSQFGAFNKVGYGSFCDWDLHCACPVTLMALKLGELIIGESGNWLESPNGLHGYGVDDALTRVLNAHNPTWRELAYAYDDYHNAILYLQPTARVEWEAPLSYLTRLLEERVNTA